MSWDNCDHGKRKDQCKQCFHMNIQQSILIPGWHLKCQRRFKNCKCELTEVVWCEVKDHLCKMKDMESKKNDLSNNVLTSKFVFYHGMLERLRHTLSQKLVPVEISEKDYEKFSNDLYYDLKSLNQDPASRKISDFYDVCLRLGIITKKKYTSSMNLVLKSKKMNTNKDEDKKVVKNRVQKRTVEDKNVLDASVCTLATKKLKIVSQSSDNATGLNGGLNGVLNGGLNDGFDDGLIANFVKKQIDSVDVKMVTGELDTCKKNISMRFFSTLSAQFDFDLICKLQAEVAAEIDASKTRILQSTLDGVNSVNGVNFSDEINSPNEVNTLDEVNSRDERELSDAKAEKSGTLTDVDDAEKTAINSTNDNQSIFESFERGEITETELEEYENLKMLIVDLRHLLGEKKCTCEEYEEYVEERKPVENAPERSIENHKWMCGAVWREYKEFTRRSYKNDVVGHQNHPVYKRLYARGKATLDEYDEYFNTCDQIRQGLVVFFVWVCISK